MITSNRKGEARYIGASIYRNPDISKSEHTRFNRVITVIGLTVMERMER